MSEERGLETDEEEIKIAQDKAREASKSVKEAAHTFAKLDVHQIAELDKSGIMRPNDDAKFSKGDITGKVQLIYDGKEFLKSTEGIPSDKPFSILLDKTN